MKRRWKTNRAALGTVPLVTVMIRCGGAPREPGCMARKDKVYGTDCTAGIKTLLQPLFNETDEKSQGTELLALEREAAGDFNT